MNNVRGLDVRHALMQAPAGVAEVDLATRRYLRVNESFCALLGRTASSLLDDFDVIGVTYEADRGLHDQQWHRLAASGEGFDTELRYLRADGSVIWVHVCASRAHALNPPRADDAPMRGFVIVRDIRATNRLREGLLAQHELLDLALEIGEVGCFQRDYVNGLIHCSAKTREMHGLPAGDTPLPSAIWRAMLLPEDRASVAKRSAEAFAARRPHMQMSYRYRHPQRGLRIIETRSRVTYSAQGTPLASLGVAIDVTARRETEARLAHLAHYDELTALPNRSLLQLCLAESLKAAGDGTGFALFIVDLDAFKDINDTLGHPFGDRLLQAVAARLRAACGPGDVVARLGGDEFALIRAPVVDPDEAAAVAVRLLAALASPFPVDGHSVSMTASLGFCVAPADGQEPEALMRHADLALHGAKAAGRGGAARFVPAMAAKVWTRRRLELDLAGALNGSELDLHYQPIFETMTGRIVSYEALLRWQHRGRGLVMPDEFVPLAEANGMIVPIGAFVLRRACAQAALWPGGETVAVNLSAAEFARADLDQLVATALAESGLDPARLEIELTERTILHDNPDNIAVLHRLRRRGIRIAIDDFGTGFSSLSYLQRFAFDTVKIDRTFTAQLEHSGKSLAIVRAIVGLCAALGVETVAEGVETAAQADILRGIGCARAQGYHFGRPAPAGARAA
jgi:diguanylate cyclase (GGDEF)-like protein/PAS domain S-box-containing protein